MSQATASPVYLGDELGATGYRLAGAESFVVASHDELEERLAAVLDGAPLILLGAGAAQWLPTARLQALLRGLRPLVVVVPDFTGNAAPPDLADWLRSQLGMKA